VRIVGYLPSYYSKARTETRVCRCGCFHEGEGVNECECPNCTDHTYEPVGHPVAFVSAQVLRHRSPGHTRNPGDPLAGEPATNLRRG
jgi:hypothetical protein